jgi:hypothetical protein
MRNFVFDMVQQTIIKMMTESTLSIAPHLQSMPVKFDDVLIYLLTIPHDEVSQLVFSITDGVVRPKVTLQLVDELNIVIHPWRPSCMRALENVWFEPIEGCSLQVRRCKNNLSSVRDEGMGVVLIVLKKYEYASKACNSVSSNIAKRTIIYYLAKHATMGNIQKDKLYE